MTQPHYIDRGLLPCPFCGSTSVEVLPKDSESEGNAWGAVQCVNFDCVTYDGVRSHGVKVRDGEDVSDERGSDAYKRAAIVRWNRRPAPTEADTSLQKVQTTPPDMEAVAWQWRYGDAEWMTRDNRPDWFDDEKANPRFYSRALAVIPTEGLGSFSQAKIPTEWSERPEVVLQYAQQVATYAAKRVGCVDEWRPLEDVYGCLTQIDNCLTGLVAKQSGENQ